MKFTAFCDLRADLRIRLATLRKSVRKFWFCKLAEFSQDSSQSFANNNNLKLTNGIVWRAFVRIILALPWSFVKKHFLRLYKTFLITRKSIQQRPQSHTQTLVCSRLQRPSVYNHNTYAIRDTSLIQQFTSNSYAF